MTILVQNREVQKMYKFGPFVGFVHFQWFLVFLHVGNRLLVGVRVGKSNLCRTGCGGGALFDCSQ